MRKLKAKVVKHVKRVPSLAPEAPEETEEVEIPLQPTTAEDEAFDILSRLAASTPAHMGTAHGIQLIHDTQAWLKAHAEPV